MDRNVKKYTFALALAWLFIINVVFVAKFDKIPESQNRVAAMENRTHVPIDGYGLKEKANYVDSSQEDKDTIKGGFL